MAINFPDSPSVNDTHTVGDRSWKWDGTVWNIVVGTTSDHGNLAGLSDDDHTQYLRTDGTRTAASLTVSGAVTVDTDTFVVDNVNDRVGIGTTSPASSAPYENYKLTLGGGGWYGYEIMNMVNGYARVTADATLDDTPGLLLNNAGANPTNHSTPGLWFTSTDSAFTTTRPKYLAGIVGRASETYNADAKGGMYIQMYLSGNNPGTANVLPGTSYGYTFGTTSFASFISNTAALGNSARLWTQLYAATTTINTSDLRDKTDVADLDYGLDFVNSLRPVTYRYAFRDSDSEGVRTHMGFIAQEVEQVLGDDASSRGVWTSSEFETTGELDENDNPVTLDIDRQGLRYEELIAPMVKAIQELSATVQTLTARIEALEAN